MDRTGFGEEFLRSRRIDAIHFISRENDWYQYDAMPRVTAKVADLTRSYQRVVAYGSSMGAYAAIRFGGMAGATEALAISPQFSIDPKTARFEMRWKDDSERIDFNLERTLKSPFVATAYIVYDPGDADRRHVKLFRRHTHVIDVGLPRVGHPATGAIAEAGLLTELVETFVDGEFSVEAFRSKVLEANRGSPQYHYVMSNRAFFRRSRLAHAARAAALAPAHFGFLTHHAAMLVLARRFDEAESVLARAASISPDHPVLLFRMTELYERQGKLDRAIEVAERLVADHSETFRPRLARLCSMRRAQCKRKRFGPGQP